MKLRMYATLASSMLLASFGTAHGATLVSGASVFVTGTTAAAEPELAGTVINDNVLDNPVTRIPDPSSIFFADFDIQNRVVRSDTDGSLIFGPRILFAANVTGSPLLVDTIELTGFGDFAMDVAYRTDGLGDRGPTFAERSADGDVLTFDFGFPLFVGNLFQQAHEESYFLSINTDARRFENTGRASIFTRSLDYPGQVFRFDYSGLAVPSAVPLPAPGLLLLAGLGLGAMARRKKRTNHHHRR